MFRPHAPLAVAQSKERVTAPSSPLRTHGNRRPAKTMIDARGGSIMMKLFASYPLAYCAITERRPLRHEKFTKITV